MNVLKSKRFGRDHTAQNSQNVFINSLLNSLANVSLRIDLTSVLNGKLFLFLLCFLLDSLGPFFCPFRNFLEVISRLFSDFLLVLKLKSTVPFLLVKVQQHLSLKVVGLVVNVDRIIILVQTFVHGLDRGLVQMASDSCCLSWLIPAHCWEWIN